MKTPCLVICGFLGTGKTTAIRHWLSHAAADPAGGRWAVIVNDFGTAGFDRQSLQGAAAASTADRLRSTSASSQPQAASASTSEGITSQTVASAARCEQAPEIDVLDVPGGCICCSAGLELLSAVHRVLDTLRPARLLIEPTGLARPSELRALLTSDSLHARLALSPIVLLVDPRRHFRPPYSKMSLCAEQAAAADVLVANFADVARPDELDQFLSWAGGFVPPKRRVLVTNHGKLPTDLLETDISSGGVQAPRPTPSQQQPAASPMAMSLPVLGPETAAQHSPAHLAQTDATHPCSRVVQAIGGGPVRHVPDKPGVFVRTWRWPATWRFSVAALDNLSRQMAAGRWPAVLRVKGVLQTNTAAAEWQYVGDAHATSSTPDSAGATQPSAGLQLSMARLADAESTLDVIIHGDAHCLTEIDECLQAAVTPQPITL